MDSLIEEGLALYASLRITMSSNATISWRIGVPVKSLRPFLILLDLTPNTRPAAIAANASYTLCSPIIGKNTSNTSS